MRLTALWWWIDRWRKSTAYTDMTLEEQGAYRNLLDEAHLRGGFLPNDERILAKACGDALAWPRIRVTVLAKFTVTPQGLQNDTLMAVITESKRRSQKQADYRSRGNEQGNGSGNEQGNALQPPVPVPVLRSGSGSGLISDLKDLANSNAVASTTSAAPVQKNGNGNARSKHPVFKGQRFVVFDWQLEDLGRLLGPHINTFDIDSWFFDLDARCLKSGEIIPQRDGGKWLQEQATAEALRRGIVLTASVDVKTAATLSGLQRFAAKKRS